jgi:hypothetical protein
MNTNVSLSQATKSLEWVWDLERIWSFVLCLGVKSRALVLNAMAENLDALKCGGWRVFIAPTTKMAVGEAVCRWAHRTVQCASHVTQPLGFDRWSSDSWDPRIVQWCTGQSLFTRPMRLLTLLWLCARCPRTVHVHCSLLQTTVGAVAVAPHGTPDSPVLHRTVRWVIAEWLSKNPKLSSSELISLVHRTLSGGTPDSPVR